MDDPSQFYIIVYSCIIVILQLYCYSLAIHWLHETSIVVTNMPEPYSK